MDNGRYMPVPEVDGTWTVIDGDTGKTLYLSGEPMVTLSEKLAVTLSKLMNMDEDAPLPLSPTFH